MENLKKFTLEKEGELIYSNSTQMESANGMMAKKAAQDLMMICEGLDIGALALLADKRPEGLAIRAIELIKHASKYEPSLPEIISRMITEAEKVK